MITPNVCVRKTDVLNDFRISFQCKFGSLCICFVNFLLIFVRLPTFGIFCVIYILVGFNHVCMVITRSFNVIGWRFIAISSQAIKLCEPLLHRYN